MKKWPSNAGIFLAIILLAMMQESSIAQQLPLFSQYVFNSLHVNPGYAGYKVDPFIQATYRGQYIDFPGAPKTFAVSADMASPNEKMGFGASLSTDQIGASRTNQVLLTYAYRIQMSNDAFLSLGVSAGAMEYSLDGSSLQPEDDTDVTLPTGKVNLFTPSVNTGLFFYTSRFFAGISAYNLVGSKNVENQDLTLSFHNIHYYLQVGGLVALSDQVEFKPSLLIREDLKGPMNFDISAMFLFNERIWAGTSYRSHLNLHNNNQSSSKKGNALAAIVEIFATEQLRIGYAYDYNLNVLNNENNSSHEISVGIYLGSKGLNREQLKCF